MAKIYGLNASWNAVQLQPIDLLPTQPFYVAFRAAPLAHLSQRVEDVVSTEQNCTSRRQLQTDSENRGEKWYF